MSGRVNTAHQMIVGTKKGLIMAKQPQEVVDLAQRLLKAAGKQSPVVMMNALLLCMQLVDATTHGPRKVGSRKTATETHNAIAQGREHSERPAGAEGYTS